MIIEESFEVGAPRPAVAALLLDVDQVSRCVPGVGDVQPVEGDGYRATLRMQLGPINTAFQGDLRLDDSQAPQRLCAVGQGRDRASGSRARVEFVADLEEKGPGRTVVSTRADVAIRGRLGQFGTGVIQSTATELVREFASCLNASLATQPQPAGHPTPAVPLSAGRVAARGLLGWLVSRLRAGLDWVRARLRGQG